jgi:hypothetical protein
MRNRRLQLLRAVRCGRRWIALAAWVGLVVLVSAGARPGTDARSVIALLYVAAVAVLALGLLARPRPARAIELARAARRAR